MSKLLIVMLCVLSCSITLAAGAEETAPPGPAANTVAAGDNGGQESDGSLDMLTSLLELRKNLREQIQLSRKKLEASRSDTERASLEAEISHLDKQLSETSSDFERIATGIEPALFAEKKPEQFSWKEEMASLLEPAIKELKRFTIRARQKTELKDRIANLEQLAAAASQGLAHLQQVIDASSDKQVQKEVRALQPEWSNIEKRLRNKLELSQRELAKLEAQDVSLVESSSRSVRNFFRDRGVFLIVAVFTFFGVLLIFRLLYQLVVRIAVKITGQPEERSFQVRLLYIVFQVLSVFFAVTGLFFVLYLAEDWFLLSMAIVFFLGLSWTIRQGVPRLWQQGRLMLNVGSVRENERIILHGVPWQVANLNVFCRLVNPALETELRVPIEHLIGLSSRPYDRDEPWFPCRKGDWVEVGGNSRAKVVSLSHEQVELVERGGRRMFYTTEAFLQACPANLSRNFRLRVPFGISYGLQARATGEIPARLREYIQAKMDEEGYRDTCLNLLVEFCQANASSLDLLVIADFDGSVADICKRIERAIQRWCVDCCTANGWEIPFPQLTVHRG